MPTNTPSNHPVTVPLSYLEALLFGDTVGRRSERDPALIWWGPDEDGVPHYRGRRLTEDEVIAHEFVNGLLDAQDSSRIV